MPDGSFAVLDCDVAPRSPAPYDELAFAASLESTITNASAANEYLNDLQLAAIDRATEATPTSLADAVAILLIAGNHFRETVNTMSSRSKSAVDAYVAFGRVLKFLATKADVHLSDLTGGTMLINPADGIDPSFAAEIWFERTLDAGMTVLLQDGKVAIYSDVDGSDDNLTRRDLMTEFRTIDRHRLKTVLRRAIHGSQYGLSGSKASDDGLWIFNQRSTNHGQEIMVMRGNGGTVQHTPSTACSGLAELSASYIKTVSDDRAAYEAMTETQRQQRSAAAVAKLFDTEPTAEQHLLQEMATQRARSAAELKAKARALWWMYGGDDVVPAFDLVSRRQDALMESLLLDLMRLPVQEEAA